MLRLCRYGFPYRVWFAFAVVAMLIYAAAHTGRAYLFKPIFDEVLPQRTGLGWVVSAVIGLTVCKGLAEYFSVYLMTGVGERMVRDLRSELFGRILAQSAGFFARRTTGGLMSRITNDINRIQQVVAQTMGDLLRESATLAGLAGLLLYQDTGLALVCLTGAPVVVYPLLRLGQRVRRTTRRGQEELEHLSHMSAEAFSGHRIVKAFAGERYEQQRFDQASERLYRMNMKVTSSVSALPPLMEWLGAFAVVGVLWYGSREIAAGDLTPGGFSLFIGAMLLMYAPIKRLSRVNANIQQAIAAAERVFETLDTRSEAADKPGARRLPPLERSIAFREVSFAYDDAPGEKVLDRVSFEVDAGQVVAVVGLSGAGKTTLVNLVPRFYEVTAGSIAIDGADIRDVTVESLRSQIGIVTQDTRAVRRHDRQQHRLRGAVRLAGRRGGRGARGPRARVHRDAAGRLRHADRRPRAAPFRRPAAARCDRPRVAPQLADPDTRRGDLVARRRVRVARAGRARQAHAQPDGVRDSAPAFDRAPRRPDRRARPRPGAGNRAPRRSAGGGRQPVRQAVCAAVVRPGRRGQLTP